MIEQPPPMPTEEPDVVDLVMVDIIARKALGIERYGVALQAGNGRDAMQDLYEELLDACFYVRQAIEERAPIRHPVKPTIGRIVHYRGKYGLHAMRAALITCTTETLMPEGVEAGTIPPLDSAEHVHLHVFTPSDQGFLVEYNVPLAHGSEVQPGEWAWPPRVS